MPRARSLALGAKSTITPRSVADGSRCRQRGGATAIDMMEYAAGLEPVTVARSRRAAAHQPMNTTEWKQRQQVVGKIIWLVTKLRMDYWCDLAALQREKGRKKRPRISALIKANQAPRELERDSTCKLVMRPIGLE
eukprot:3451290-Pyramimonas_sp.AAC.1